MIKDLKHRESIGEIKGLVVRDLPEYTYIMWDDDSLGSPIIIKKGEKILLDTPEKLVKHYKESEKINIKTILKELKENPLEVFFMTKGSFKYEENGYKMIWHDFIDKKNGKVYTIISREINRLFDHDIKTFDNFKFIMENGMLKYKKELKVNGS